MAAKLPRALQVYAGPRALAHLRERGLRPADVRVIPAAAGGPKGLILSPLDRFLVGHWLAGAKPASAVASLPGVHLLGASIGAWRMACAMAPDPDRALADLAHGYIHQRFDLVDGRRPNPTQVSRLFADTLAQQLGGQEAQLLAHPRYRLHVLTSRGCGPLLQRGGRLGTPLGYLGAFGSNLLHRRALGGWLQRVVFSDPREPLPFRLHDFNSHSVPLTPANLSPAVLASCAIPFVLNPVLAIPGAPRGAYWDGGVTDYHLHLDYASMAHGLVLYPHFQQALVPGWLDKGLRHRHRASAKLANVVVLAPRADWVRTLPGGKLPDRQDFKTWQHDAPGRIRVWQQAVAAAQQLADEAADWLASATQDALPL